MELEGKRILYISPKFFNYENKIKEELENLGAIVDFFDDRPANDFITKVLIRLKLKYMMNKKINKYYLDISNFIKSKSYDYVFIISPETLSYKELEMIKEIQPKAKYLLYMWDSFKNKNSFNTIGLFDKVFSFDSRDATEYTLTFLPLFYINEYTQLSLSDYEYDLTFIATAHSDRYIIAKQILEKLQKYRIYYYFYLPSKIIFYVRKYLIKKYKYEGIEDFSFLPLEHAEIIDIFKKSMSILDINHPKQFGLTMRTFECLGAKKKLITTNENIKNYDFYNENNILVIDRDNIDINESFFKSPYTELNLEIYEKYSITQWLKTIFNKD
jgi:hypothetical protein